MRKGILALLMCAMFVGSLIAVAPLGGAAKPRTGLSIEEQSLVDHMDGAYAYDLCRRLASFPYPYLGEVVTGSQEDYLTALYLADEMRSLGLSDVTIESFPLVSFDYKSCSLEITSPVVQNPSIDARSMANSPPTPGGGPIEGELVFVGLGWTEDYEQIPGGVEGKIVLVERSEVMWMTTPAVDEAAFHGAIAALIHNPARDPAAMNIDCAHNKIPTLSIRGNDAEYLKGLLMQETVTVKLAVDTDITEDSPAHTVYGYIWGSEYRDEYVLFEAHLDHWWSGARDNNGGIAATLAIADAVRDAGITPKRTMVFMVNSGHESGTGGSKESYWDWALGSYCFSFWLHPEWAGKVVGAFVADGVGRVSDYMMVETTPELNGLLVKAARDLRVGDLMTPYIFTPVSSFDGWGFYMAGMPTMNTYYGSLQGAFQRAFYHTDLDTIANIHPEYLRMDAAFRAVAGLRLSQASILPYELGEISKESRQAVDRLLLEVPDADLDELLSSLSEFEAEAQEVQRLIGNLKHPSPSTVAEVNEKLLKCIKVVDPALWDQDIGLEYPLPGWCSVSKFDTYTNDIARVRDAIAALNVGDIGTAQRMLEDVVTMDWGEHVSYEVYQDVVWLFNGTPYLNWATGHLPWLTNVHQDWWTLKSGSADIPSVIASLSAKLSVLYEKLGATEFEVKTAFDQGTAILASI